MTTIATTPAYEFRRENDISPRDNKYSSRDHAASTPLLSRILHARLDGGFAMNDYWIWCPSVIRAPDGTFCMFASRWPKSNPFHPAWLLNSEVVLATSAVAEGPYEFQHVVLPARGAEYWDGRATHNPRSIKWRDQYALFYTGMSHPLQDVQPQEILTLDDPRVIVSRASKRVGVALAPSLYGPWRRMDSPILPTQPRTFYSFLTSNASPCLESDGSVFLVFKGRRYERHTHSPMLLGVARANDIAGPYKITGPLSIKTESGGLGGEVEDPFVWRTEGSYEMIAKDMTGCYCGEHHAGIHASSADGLAWTLSSDRKAYSRALQWSDGQTRTMGSVERASLLFENARPTHLVAAIANGPGGFAHADNTWNSVVPLSS